MLGQSSFERKAHILTRKQGGRREPSTQPFRVIKETFMRFSRVVAGIFFLLAVASAEIKIKVVDPQDAAVAGAQVQLLRAGKPAPAAVVSTSGEGTVGFREAASSSYRVNVLAPGFAPGTPHPSATSPALQLQRRVATHAE